MATQNNTMTAGDQAMSKRAKAAAKELARLEWPLASPEEQQRWVEGHWERYLPKAEAALAAAERVAGEDAQIRLGDVIRFKNTYRYASDWRGEFVVIGIRFDNFGRENITISEGKNERGEWIAPTDDFRPEDMELVRAALALSPGKVSEEL
jgi:hypothetical protein